MLLKRQDLSLDGLLQMKLRSKRLLCNLIHWLAVLRLRL